jgi:hypothetical protein
MNHNKSVIESKYASQVAKEMAEAFSEVADALRNGRTVADVRPVLCELRAGLEVVLTELDRLPSSRGSF